MGVWAAAAEMLAKSAEACSGVIVVVWTKWVGMAVTVTVTVAVAVAWFAPAPATDDGSLGVPDPEFGSGGPLAEPSLVDELDPVGPPVAPRALNKEFAVRSLVQVTVW